MRRVLIVAYDFPPRGATGVLRVAKFVRYLPEFGWQPVVVTAAASAWSYDQGLLAQLPPQLEIVRVRHPLQRTSKRPVTPKVGQRHAALQSRSKQLLRRLLLPDPQILWVPIAVRAATARLDQRNIDVVFTTSPPHSVQLVGWWLKRRFPMLPWVMDLRDVWSDSPTIPDPLSYKINRWFEGECVSLADRVVVVTEPMRGLLHRTHGVALEKLHTITNGFDPADFAVPAARSKRGVLRIAYVGTIIGTRVPAARAFFGALAQLTAEGVDGSRLEVRLVGAFDAQIHQWAEPFVAQGSVQILPFATHAEAVDEMAQADVLLLLMPDDWESRIAVPNKLYEYLAARRPILAITPEGEITQLLQMMDAGLAVTPGSVEEIVGALRTLLQQHETHQLAAPHPNDPRLTRFQRRELTHQLAALLDEVVS
jgi:glycosyltransferase involved in cell wall biosynthesis